MQGLIHSKNSQFKPVITRFNRQVSHLMLKKNDILDQMVVFYLTSINLQINVTIQSQKILFDNITDSKSGSWLWCRIHGIPNANRIFYPISGSSIQNCQIYHLMAWWLWRLSKSNGYIGFIFYLTIQSWFWICSAYVCIFKWTAKTLLTLNMFVNVCYGLMKS